MGTTVFVGVNLLVKISQHSENSWLSPLRSLIASILVIRLEQLPRHSIFSLYALQSIADELLRQGVWAQKVVINVYVGTQVPVEGQPLPFHHGGTISSKSSSAISGSSLRSSW
jgi:hypothetical protein